MKHVIRTTALILGSASSAIALSAAAQTNAANPSGQATLEEVVVTSRRMEENLQSIPVAVTAISSLELQTNRIVDVLGLQRVTPGLSIATGSPSASGFVFVGIRGAAQLAPGVSADPAVGIYQDGIYIPRPSQGLTDLNDIQRVEVLRGPQGTLFGRNTTGGAISIVTNDPVDEFEGEVKGELGDYNHASIGGVLNTPITDGLALRVTANHRERDGYGNNTTLHRDANDLDSDYARAKLRWAPTDSDWSAALSADYNKITDSGQLVQLSGVNLAIPFSQQLPPPVAEAVAAPYNAAMAPYIVNGSNWYETAGTGYYPESNFREPFNEMEAWGNGLVIQGSIGDLDVKSITGYRYSNNEGLIDLDATPTAILVTNSAYKSKQWSQEFQVSGEWSDRFNWITGLYYSTEDGEEFSKSQALAQPLESLAGQNAPIRLDDGDAFNDSVGVFAQSYYDLTETLQLTTGLRWTWDERKVELHNRASVDLPPDDPANCIVPNPDGGTAPPCTQTEKENFDYPAWTVGLDYQLSDELFVYGKTSGASKAGGWNLRAGTELAPAFKDEDATDVEFGLKSELLDGRLRTNIALFYVWYGDLQRNAQALITVNGQPSTTQYLRNAGDAEVYGAEFEVSALPWQGMTLNASLSLMQGEYTSYEDVYTGGIVNREDEEYPQLPESQFNLGATQVVATSIGEFSFHAAFSYMDEQIYSGVTGSDTVAGASSLANAKIQNDLATASDYSLVNARVAWQVMDSNLELALWGSNLTDEQYNTKTFADLYTQIGLALSYPGAPRTWGGSVYYRF